MPTGYTHAVQDGSITEFKDFAMQCARAFGACIMMRDEPQDAVIPEVFEPSDYHVKALASARKELSRLNSLTIDQQAAECEAANDAADARWTSRESERQKHRERYEAMLAKVAEWTPPTGEHVEMKSFMQQQLAESIQFDCGHAWEKPTRKKRSEWYDEAVTRAKRDIEYHATENAKEVARARGRTEWVAALRRSLEQST